MTRTMCLAGILVTVLVTAPAARQSSSSPPPDWSAVTGQLEHAVLGDDAPGVRRARTDLLRLLAAGPAPDRAALVQYAIAYAGWRLSTNPAVSGRERDDLLDDAEERLKTAVKVDPKFAEGYALLSGVYGLKISVSPMSGILLGPRSGGAIDRAEQLEPDNPRVLLSRGIGKFNTPAMFGGSIKDAEACLRRAIDRFAVESPAKPFPAWGRFDAHAWLGQVLAKRGDKAAARAEYERALEVAPKSGWVQFVLMPALDKR
ncbi:MAG: tetratricopeptide repeat protein [Acidobacteriota bacterium]